MTVVRQDAWSPDNDLILAEVTLRHIREGSTQLSAFEEVGQRIARTSAACGFRWNSCVRKRYNDAIALAKKQRQQRNHLKKHGMPGSVTNATKFRADDGKKEETEGISQEFLSFEAIIRYLTKWKNSFQKFTKQQHQLERQLKEKNDKLKELLAENNRLTQNIDDVQTDYRVVNDDYKTLIQIMDRARRLALLSEEKEEERTRFKMEANGNLERIE